MWWDESRNTYEGASLSWDWTVWNAALDSLPGREEVARIVEQTVMERDYDEMAPRSTWVLEVADAILARIGK